MQASIMKIMRGKKSSLKLHSAIQIINELIFSNVILRSEHEGRSSVTHEVKLNYQNLNIESNLNTA